MVQGPLRRFRYSDFIRHKCDQTAHLTCVWPELGIEIHFDSDFDLDFDF